MTAVDPVLHGSTFLASLPQQVRHAWTPLLTPVYLRAGMPLYESSSPIRSITFPVTCVVALVDTMRRGDSAMTAMVGHEGALGLSAAMSGRLVMAEATIVLDGWALRMEASPLNAAFHEEREFRSLLMRYLQAFMIQGSLRTLCSRHCSPDGQLATVLLQAMDRGRRRELALTQERLAGLLGRRRETLTLASNRLQARGALKHSRGQITLADRAVTEAHACDCYAALHHSYTEIWTAPQWPESTLQADQEPRQVLWRDGDRSVVPAHIKHPRIDEFS